MYPYQSVLRWGRDVPVHPPRGSAEIFSIPQLGSRQIETLQLFDIEEEQGQSEEVFQSGNSRLDLAAEYFVAFDLTYAGYPCSMAAPGLAYDLAAVMPGGGLSRIQVKSTGCPRLINVSNSRERRAGRGRKKLRYVFELERPYLGFADVFALVALEQKLILYVPVKNVRRLKINPSIMRADYCAISRQQCFGEPNHEEIPKLSCPKLSGQGIGQGH